jgi:hypothetical protein
MLSMRVAGGTTPFWEKIFEIDREIYNGGWETVEWDHNGRGW